MLTLFQPSPLLTKVMLAMLVSLSTAASASAVETRVSRLATVQEKFQWKPGDQQSLDRLRVSDTALVVEPSVGEGDDLWIVEPEGSIACDANPSSVSIAACSDGCADRQHWYWAKAEYLYWHSRGMEIPALATTSSAGTQRDQSGILGQQATSIVLGQERFNDQGDSGGRFSLGFWLDHCQDFGIDFIYTTLGEDFDSFSASSDQIPILARPFFNVDTLSQDSRVLGFPGEVSGGLQVTASSSYDVYEVLIRRPLSRDFYSSTFIVYGYRSAELDESLRIVDSSRSLSGATAGATVASFDRFRSKNVFHGFEAGILTDFRLTSCWLLNIEGKVAFGETDHTTTINGQTTSRNSAGDSSTRAGGLLTQTSNIGRFESNSHGVLQDFSIGLRRQMPRGITGHVAYTIHRWNDVARAGEQIDLEVNPTQIPPGTLVGDPQPQPLEVTSSFIVQGVTFGLECAW